MRAEGEVGTQRDNQDFRGYGQWGHRITVSHMRVEPKLVGIRGEQCHARLVMQLKKTVALKKNMFYFAKKTWLLKKKKCFFFKYSFKRDYNLL